ncbi:UNVERIFIED_CONTAM: hypothetical protein Sradi_5224900 [Sesamum radiatum]|uniref:Uncharacterized protein n=1 Tax=Sesamum radiatum TaxID=300843 RepID=A0AAW2LKJ2_SESRA
MRSPRQEAPNKFLAQKSKCCIYPVDSAHHPSLYGGEGKDLLAHPKSARHGPQWPKFEKFCHFHYDYGNTTKERGHLKKEIERLIQNGYLQEYVCVEKARGIGPYQNQESNKAKVVKDSSPESLPKETPRSTLGGRSETNDSPRIG